MSSIEDCFRSTRMLCNLLGVWPMSDGEDNSILRKLFLAFRRVFAVLVLASAATSEIIAIVENWGDVPILTRSGYLLLAYLVAVYKTVYVVLNGPKLARIYFTIAKTWEMAATLEEKTIYESYPRKGGRYTVVAFSIGIGIIVSGAASIIIEGIKNSFTENSETLSASRRLPFEGSYGFDVDPSPIYEIVFISQIMSTTYGAASVVGENSIMLILALCISGQFARISFWYQEIGSRPIEKEFPVQEIKKCLRHHQKMIEVADQLDNVVGPVLFLHLLSSAASICLCAYAATTVVGNHLGLMSLAEIFIDEMLHLYVWCMVGETLMEESQGVGHAAFHCTEWYRFPKNLQRDLCLVIRRSQKPCCLTAAKFQVFNIETLNQVFNSAVSYFMLLRQINDQ